jgi:hypothetical protein
VLALPRVFTRIFSVVIWHHFSYRIIGIALLGGGAAGVFLALRGLPRDVVKQQLWLYAVGFSLSILLALALVAWVPVDPLRREQLALTVVGLAAYFGILFSMFLMAGLVIAGAFGVWSARAHRLYFADLLGASISTLVTIWVARWLGAPSTLVLLALLGLLAATLLNEENARRPWLAGLWGIELAIFAWVLLNPVLFPIPDSKPLSWALAASGASEPEYTRWNPVARVDVTGPVTVTTPMIVGGISSRAVETQLKEGQEYQLRFVTLDGTSMTGLYAFDGDLSRFDFLKNAIIAAPYFASAPEPSTLLIGVGGGIDILLARQFDARKITAIDLNSDVVDLVKNRYSDEIGRLAELPGVSIETAEGRSFLTAASEHWDVIQGIGLDNIAALNSGAYVLSESYLYTVEAFELALNRLTPRGVFSWTRASSTPPIETLRLAGIAAQALRNRGVADPDKHIIVVGNEEKSAINLLVSPSPFAVEQVESVRSWAASNAFPILHDPLVPVASAYSEYLRSVDPIAFESTYPFNINPVTDDAPFYYNYFRWRSLLAGGAESGNLSSRVPIGNFILLIMILFTLVTAALFIILPLWRQSREGITVPYSRQLLIYFGALGLGYMFVQIVLIQRFTLFVGYPTLAISVTVFSMLFFSALGSLAAGRLIHDALDLRRAVYAVAAAIVIYLLVLPFVLAALLGWSDGMRATASVALIAPLAFLMGMPFPTGIRIVGANAPPLVPWAWGMNGIFSVLGSTAVVVLSMLSSFSWSLLVAAMAYAVAAVVAPALARIRIEGIHEYTVASPADGLLAPEPIFELE